MCTLYYHSEDYETVATDAKPELTKPYRIIKCFGLRVSAIIYK